MAETRRLERVRERPARLTNELCREFSFWFVKGFALGVGLIAGVVTAVMLSYILLMLFIEA